MAGHLSFSQCKREQRASTGSWNNPTVLRQNKLNGHMVLAEGPPNLTQRLSRLPTAQVGPLIRGKLYPSPLRHKHHLWRKDLYQMVFRRPIETAGLVGMWPKFKCRPSVSSE